MESFIPHFASMVQEQEGCLVEDTTAAKADEKIVISQKDLDTLTDLLETYKTAILGHEERIQVLEAAVGTIHTALTKPKMVVPSEFPKHSSKR